MDKFRFKHIGAPVSFSFPNRNPTMAPTLLSRMSENEEQAVEHEDKAEAAPRRPKSPKVSRPLRNRISPPHIAPSLSDRIEFEPLSNRISIPGPPASLANRISTAQPPAPKTPLESRVSPSALAKGISPLESPHASLASRIALGDTEKASESECGSSTMHADLPARSSASISAPKITQTLQTVVHTPLPLPPAAAALKLPAEPLPSSIATHSHESRFPASILPNPPLVNPDTPVRPQPPPMRSIFTPSSNLFPSPSKTVTPSSSPGKPGMRVSGRLDLYMLPVWAESEAQMREWAEVANEQAVQRSQAEKRLAGKKRDREVDESEQLNESGKENVVEPNPKKVRVATPEPCSSVISEHEHPHPGGDRASMGLRSSPMSISESESDSVIDAQLATEREHDSEVTSRPVDVASVVGSTVKDCAVSFLTGRNEESELERTTRRDDATGSSHLEKQTEGVDKLPQSEQEDRSTAHEEASRAALLLVEERQRRELEEEMATRKRNLEQELAILAREERERVKKERQRKEDEERQREEAEAAVRALKEKREREERALKERESKLREEVQKRKQKIPAHTTIDLAVPLSPMSTVIGTTQTTSTLPTAITPVAPVQLPAPVQARTFTPSFTPAVQGSQHPLPPKPTPHTGGVRMSLYPSKPAAPPLSAESVKSSMPKPSISKPQTTSNQGKENSGVQSVDPEPSSVSTSRSTAKRPASGANATTLLPNISSSRANTSAPVAPSLLPHPVISTTQAPVPTSLASTTLQQTAPTPKPTVTVKQEAIEPQLGSGRPKIAGRASRASAPLIPVQSASMPVPPPSNMPSIDSVLPHTRAPSFPKPKSNGSPLDQKPPKVVISQDPSISQPSADLNVRLIKREPTPKADSELLLAPSTSRTSTRSSSVDTTSRTSLKRPRSISSATSANPIVKKRRDSSLETEMELTYPDAVSETSGWGHADLDDDDDEGERRPGARFRRPRTRTPLDAPSGPDGRLTREASPNWMRTPPRLPSRSRSTSRSRWSKSRSRSRSPVHAERGRGGPPRGPRGRGNGRTVGTWRTSARYEPGLSLMRPRSRTPPRIVRARSPIGPPPLYDHWSPTPPRPQGRLSPRPLRVPLPFTRPYVPAAEREGRWQTGTYRPVSPPARYDTRLEPDVSDRMHKPRTPPRESSPSHERHIAPSKPSYYPSPHSPRSKDLLSNHHNESTEDRSVPVHMPPKVPGPFPATTSSSAQPSSSRPPRGPLAMRGGPMPGPGDDGPGASLRYAPYPPAHRVVSASSVQHPPPQGMDDSHSAVHLRSPFSNNKNQTLSHALAAPSQSLMDRIQGQRSVTSPEVLRATDDSGPSPTVPRRGAQNQRVRGRGSLANAPTGRAKLAARLTDAPSGGSLIGRMDRENGSV